MPAGRPAHEPTDKDRRIVLEMTGYGITQEDMARALGISEHTLQKHYREELDRGAVEANTTVARNLFQIATSKGKGAVAAATFWLKCRAGWRQYDRVPDIEVTPVRGKKEQAAIDAQTAGEGTGWERYLRDEDSNPGAKPN